MQMHGLLASAAHATDPSLPSPLPALCLLPKMLELPEAHTPWLHVRISLASLTIAIAAVMMQRASPDYRGQLAPPRGVEIIASFDVLRSFQTAGRCSGA